MVPGLVVVLSTVHVGNPWSDFPMSLFDPGKFSKVETPFPGAGNIPGGGGQRRRER